MRKTALVILGAVLVFVGIVYVPHLLAGTGPTGAGLDFQAAIAKSLPLALGVVFVGGILTSLTPCVYPLIPITVSIFGAREGVSRLKGAALSSVYVLGMAVMYTGMGIGAALTGRAFGHVMANPWVIGFVALVFILFGLSMLGLFELNLPTGLQTRLSQVGGEGWGGAFAMGLVSGIVAAPCTGPILGGVLTYVATTQNVALGGVLLFTFSIGMGLLFFVLGTFAVSLPKSGNWMDAVKSVLAVVMFVVALYFLKDVIPPLKSVLIAAPWVAWLTAGLAALGILIGAIHFTYHDPWGKRVLKTGGLVLLTGALFYRVGSLTVIEAPKPGATAGTVAVTWYHTEEKAVAAARAEHKPLLLDFSADWCTACKELAKVTYTNPKVEHALGRFVAAQIDLSNDDSPEYKKLQSKYHFPGLPYVVFVDSKGERREDLTVTGFLPPKDFLKRMKQVD